MFKRDTRDLLTRLQMSADDPMWSDHAEVNKRTLRDAILFIRTVHDQLHHFDTICIDIGGCGDANCVIWQPKGMRTNGGCTCAEDRSKMRRFSQRVAYFRDRLGRAMRGVVDE